VIGFRDLEAGSTRSLSFLFKHGHSTISSPVLSYSTQPNRLVHSCTNRDRSPSRGRGQRLPWDPRLIIRRPNFIRQSCAATGRSEAPASIEGKFESCTVQCLPSLMLIGLRNHLGSQSMPICSRRGRASCGRARSSLEVEAVSDLHTVSIPSFREFHTRSQLDLVAEAKMLILLAHATLGMQDWTLPICQEMLVSCRSRLMREGYRDSRSSTDSTSILFGDRSFSHDIGNRNAQASSTSRSRGSLLQRVGVMPLVRK